MKTEPEIRDEAAILDEVMRATAIEPKREFVIERPREERSMGLRGFLAAMAALAPTVPMSRFRGGGINPNANFSRDIKPAKKPGNPRKPRNRR